MAQRAEPRQLQLLHTGAADDSPVAAAAAAPALAPSDQATAASASSTPDHPQAVAAVEPARPASQIASSSTALAPPRPPPGRPTGPTRGTQPAQPQMRRPRRLLNLLPNRMRNLSQSSAPPTPHSFTERLDQPSGKSSVSKAIQTLDDANSPPQLSSSRPPASKMQVARTRPTRASPARPFFSRSGASTASDTPATRHPSNTSLPTDGNANTLTSKIRRPSLDMRGSWGGLRSGSRHRSRERSPILPVPALPDPATLPQSQPVPMPPPSDGCSPRLSESTATTVQAHYHTGAPMRSARTSPPASYDPASPPSTARPSAASTTPRPSVADPLGRRSISAPVRPLFNPSTSGEVDVPLGRRTGKRGWTQVSRKMKMPAGNGRMTFRGNKDWPAELGKDSNWKVCWLEMDCQSVYLYTGLGRVPSDADRRQAVREVNIPSRKGKSKSLDVPGTVMVDELPLVMTTIRIPGVPAGTAAGSQHGLNTTLVGDAPESPAGGLDLARITTQASAGQPPHHSTTIPPNLTTAPKVMMGNTSNEDKRAASKLFGRSLLRNTSHRVRDNVFELVSLNDRRFVAASNAADMAEWVQAIREGTADALLNMPSHHAIPTNLTIPAANLASSTITTPSEDDEKHEDSLAGSLDHSSGQSSGTHGSDVPPTSAATAGSSVSVASALSYTGYGPTTTTDGPTTKMDFTAPYSSSVPSGALPPALPASSRISPTPPPMIDYVGEVRAIAQLPENRFCADCHAPNPRWASWSLLEQPCCIFLCIQCTSVHRALGVHVSKVKSIDLDTWNEAQVGAARAWGNARANAYWEHGLPAQFVRHAPSPNATSTVAQAMATHPSSLGSTSVLAAASASAAHLPPSSPHLAGSSPTSPSSIGSEPILNHRVSSRSAHTHHSIPGIHGSHGRAHAVALHLHLHPRPLERNQSDHASSNSTSISTSTSERSSPLDEPFYDAQPHIAPPSHPVHHPSQSFDPAQLGSLGSVSATSSPTLLPTVGSGYAVRAGATMGRAMSPNGRDRMHTGSPPSLRPSQFRGTASPGRKRDPDPNSETREADLFWIYKYVERRWAPSGPFPETLWSYGLPQQPPLLLPSSNRSSPMTDSAQIVGSSSGTESTRSSPITGPASVVGYSGLPATIHGSQHVVSTRSSPSASPALRTTSSLGPNLPLSLVVSTKSQSSAPQAPVQTSVEPPVQPPTQPSPRS